MTTTTMTPALTLLEFDETGIPFIESFSPFCLKVHRTLGYLKLPYSVERPGAPGDIKRINPKGQLPVLTVGDEHVIDSTNIVDRLEREARISLSGGTPAIAAEARLWEEMADGALYGFVVCARWCDEENWKRTREAYFAGVPGLLRGLIANSVRKKVMGMMVARDVWRGGPEECWSRLASLLADFEVRAPETGFFLGEELTRADIALFAQLQSFRTVLTPVQKAMVEKHPRLVAWLDRVDLATRVG